MAAIPFGRQIVNWYQLHRRALPWRERSDEYAVWVSEIMLQQTRVEAVIPYYEDWMARFPTIKDLAAASQQEVLAQWEGLGYYSRARNLHRAAIIVMARHGGVLPRDLDGLLTLPGIGNYTAGAIASIVFGLDVPAVDGNVKRVLARVFNVADAVDTRAGERRIWELAGERLPSGKASEYNQGLMELGARICKPRNPLCDECPVNKDCQAYALGNQAERPVRKPKAAIPLHYLAAAIIRTGDSVILRKRPQEGLLGGMWEYPNVRIVERGSGEAAPRRLRESVAEELGLQIQVDSQVAELKHAYTHFRVNLKAYHCRLLPESARLRERRSSRLVPLNKLGDYPMGKLDRQISQQVSKEITE